MKKYYNISFEITHLCNKYCDECSHRIKSSNYKYLTIPEYDEIFLQIKHIPISEVEIIGGEPLVHPQFDELMSKIFNDFGSSRMILLTNGKLLHKLNRNERDRFNRIYITHYNGFNENEIKEVINEKNIFINRENFIKIDDSKKLNIAEAKKIFKYCPNKVYRFIGTRLYNCCHAESIERMILKKKIHVDLHEDINWRKTIKSIHHYEACQYCIFATSSINRKRLIRCYLRLIRKKFFLNSPLAKFNFKILWQISRYIKNKRNWHMFSPLQLKENKSRSKYITQFRKVILFH